MCAPCTLRGLRVVVHRDKHGNSVKLKDLENGNSKTVERYSYLGHDIVLQRDRKDNLTHRYLHGPAVDQVLADESIFEDDSTNVLYPLQDKLNSVTDLVDFDPTTQTSFVANHIDYDSTGNVISETNPLITTIIAHAGRERDPESDLLFNRARYFDPALNVFISQDPTSFLAHDPNLYRYVRNNAVSFIDPTGLDHRKTAQGVVRAVGGHHPVPWATWQGLGLPVPVQNVFNEVIAHSPDHSWDAAHSAYNKRVGAKLGLWLDTFKNHSKITTADARKFKNGILNSTDEFISGYLTHMKKGSSKAVVAEWFSDVGSRILKNDSMVLKGLGKGARVVGSIAKKSGKVFKIIAIGTAVYYVCDGGVLYACERTVKDAVFFDEIEPYARKVGTIVDNELTSRQLGVIENRLADYPEDLHESYLRGALKDYPDIYRLKFGEDPPPEEPEPLDVNDVEGVWSEPSIWNFPGWWWYDVWN